ncbi:TRPA1 [Mytilus coruscus]|uniref:TRPA1 n=1 Tax=Mytilus coruscus TaxID=42192 RepID=A0A6J8DQ85_MYTCO|nr:TRPA1 [Mytilus coruscus]
MSSSCHTTICKDLSHPTTCQDLSHPSICQDLSRPSICQDLSHPSICQALNPPTICQDLDHLTICQDLGHPTICQDLSHPTICQALSHPTICQDLGHPTICQDLSQPTLYQDLDHPTICQDLGHPTICQAIHCHVGHFRCSSIFEKELVLCFSSIGIYFIMFTEVMISLLKPGFKDREAYPLTTLSMMLGEFNYIDNFTTGANDPFAIDGYCIMFLFFLVMPLALMNFLTGIAVGDIETVRAGAYISKISIFIDKSYLMEIRFPRSVQRKWQKLKHIVYPNKPEGTVWKKVKKVLVGSEEELIKKYLDTGKAHGVDETDELKTLIKKQSSQITKLHDLQKQQQDLIKQLADHLHMDYKMDSFSVAESEMTTRAGH